MLCEKELEKYSDSCNYLSYGGYDSAIRKIIAIYPLYDECDMGDLPIDIVRFTYRNGENLSHRDFLGALMSLQIKRSLIGDIICKSDIGQSFAIISKNATRLVLDVDKVGKSGVKASLVQMCDIPQVESSFVEKNITVASMRLDVIVSGALSISREKASEMIKANLVAVNHVVRDSVSSRVLSDDILSIRGKGKFIISTNGDMTKKGRICLTVKKYI